MNTARIRFLIMCIAAAGFLTGYAQEKNNAPLLTERDLWRCRIAWGTDLARTEEGDFVPVHPYRTKVRKRKKVDGKRKYYYEFNAQKKPVYWSLPSENWKDPGFNADGWPAMKARFCAGPVGSSKRGYKSTPLMCFRRTFSVENVRDIKKMEFSMVFLGGAVVYLNGKEAARSHMPDGEISPSTPALDYPKDVFLDPDGQLWDQPSAKNRKKWREFEKKLGSGSMWEGEPVPKDTANTEAFVKRLRRMSVSIPVSMLRKGDNVLCIEIHRSPAPAKFFYGTSKRFPNPKQLQHVKKYCWWSRIGLKEVKLDVDAPEGAVSSNSGPVKGFRVWRHPVLYRISENNLGDPSQPVRDIHLCGAANGSYSALCIAGSDTPLSGLDVACTDLKGPSVIPASGVQIRYVRVTNVIGTRYTLKRHRYDALTDTCPQEIPVSKKMGGAIQPVWITVNVPAGTQPGDYTADLTFKAQGREDVKTRICMEVTGWQLPDTQEFFTTVDLVQSPDSVALQYGADMWSDAHWKLLDRTFSLMSTVGAKSIYIIPQRKTHFGNEHAMIPFTKEDDGSFTPDFTNAEKYIDLAVKHLGKIPIVIMYAWRSPWETGHFGHHKASDRKILISVKEAGGLKKAEGPQWGTPECRAFWKPVFNGIKKILAKHGIRDSLHIGMDSDYSPTDTSLNDLKEASGGAPWASHSHVVHSALGSKKQFPVAFVAAGWGGHTHHVDPEFGRGYGWMNPYRRTQTRGYPDSTTQQRLWLERLVTSRVSPKFPGEWKLYKSRTEDLNWGLHGIGRWGVDFWPVLGKGGRKKYLAGRYKETAWGQLTLGCCGLAVLYPAENGPSSSVCLELLRGNLQEIEARIFLEKILLNKEKRAKLGEELAAKAQSVLDERVRVCNRCGHYRETVASGVFQVSARLFRVAGEAAEKVK